MLNTDLELLERDARAGIALPKLPANTKPVNLPAKGTTRWQLDQVKGRMNEVKSKQEKSDEGERPPKRQTRSSGGTSRQTAGLAYGTETVGASYPLPGLKVIAPLAHGESGLVQSARYVISASLELHASWCVNGMFNCLHIAPFVAAASYARRVQKLLCSVWHIFPFLILAFTSFCLQIQWKTGRREVCGRCQCPTCGSAAEVRSGCSGR